MMLSFFPSSTLSYVQSDVVLLQPLLDVPSCTQQHQHQPQQNQSLLKLPKGAWIEPRDLYHALVTLYEDQLRPYGRILRKRLFEVVAASGKNHVPNFTLAELRKVCRTCKWCEV